MRLLVYIHELVHFWEHAKSTSTREKLEGLAFSICATLDGESVGIPAFRIIPNPNPEDKEYHCHRKENWWPDDCDISGLHGVFHTAKGEPFDEL